MMPTTRITVDVSDEWLHAAREELGTDTKVATISAALHAFALRRKAAEIAVAFDNVDGFRRFGTGLGLWRRTRPRSPDREARPAEDARTADAA